MSINFAFAMDKALEEAVKSRWQVAPNPCVGAALVKDGEIVALGSHKFYGGDHAEVDCLHQARQNGIDPSLCTLVVTLEPCNHQGQTPPCTKAILEAGIKHVIIGCLDPNPKSLGGAEFLRQAGVTVEIGLEEEKCREVLADFLVWQQKKRPYVILKLASTLDGRIATRTGQARWISSPESRTRVHELRAQVGQAGGAVLVGGNTLYADNPLLTARCEGAGKQPLAVSVTSRLSGLNSLRLSQERPNDTIFFTTAAGAASPVALELRKKGVRVFGVDPWKSNQGIDLQIVLQHLSQAGCHYVLCEGGGRMGLSLLQGGLVDEFHLHLSPKVLGDQGAKALFSGREPLSMDEALSMRIVKINLCGSDCHILLRPQVK